MSYRTEALFFAAVPPEPLLPKVSQPLAVECPRYDVAIKVQRFSLPELPRNSANSVELLIFVTNHGSCPELVASCSWMGLPMGVDPKAIE